MNTGYSLKMARLRRAFTEELENPNEFLFARPKLHANKTLYKRYALVLWIVTDTVATQARRHYDKVHQTWRSLKAMLLSRH